MQLSKAGPSTAEDDPALKKSEMGIGGLFLLSSDELKLLFKPKLKRGQMTCVEPIKVHMVSLAPKPTSLKLQNPRVWVFQGTTLV